MECDGIGSLGVMGGEGKASKGSDTAQEVLIGEWRSFAVILLLLLLLLLTVVMLLLLLVLVLTISFFSDFTSFVGSFISANGSLLANISLSTTVDNVAFNRNDGSKFVE